MKIRNPRIIRMAARMLVWAFKLLYLTTRKNYIDTVSGCYSAEPEDHFIYITWHDALLSPIFVTKSYDASALISRHEDGSYLADAMQMVGITPIRGSSSRGGAQAVKQLADQERRYHIYITPDGPRGPRHELKPGTVYLASQSGMGIQCIGCYIDRAWRIQGSWTDMVIPKPFSRVYMRSAPTIRIPPNLNRDELQPYIQLVESTLNRINEITRRIAEGEEIDIQAAFSDLETPRAAA